MTGLWSIDLSNQSDSLSISSSKCLYDHEDVPPGFKPLPIHFSRVSHPSFPKTASQLVEYYYRTFGNQPVSTFLSAVTSGFVSLPGLTPALARKYAPNLIATAKEHLDRKRQGLNSTKPSTVPSNNHNISSGDSDSDWFNAPPQANPPVSHQLPASVFFQTIDTSDRCHVDLTAKFPVTSLRGNQYVMVFYHESDNYIHVEALASRSKTDYVKAFASGVVTRFMRHLPHLSLIADSKTQKLH